MIFGWGFPWALPKATLTMAVGQIVVWVAVPFSLGVAQGYVDYGRWPNCGVGCGAFFPWALPKATLTMAVGQLWFGGAPDPGLRPGLSANDPSGLNRKNTDGTNQIHAATDS